jgi:hypothetical protein
MLQFVKFCLNALSIDGSGVLMSYIDVVSALICSFMSSSIYFIKLSAPTFGAYNFITVVSSQ